MRKASRAFVRLIICLAFLASLAWSQVYVEIRIAQARARSAPSSDSKIVATLKKGEAFAVIDDLPYWYAIRLTDGKKAYVAKSSCRVTLEEEPEEEDHGEEDVILPSPSWTLAPIYKIPQCSPSRLDPDWSVCPSAGSGGKSAAAYQQKNRVEIPCEFKRVTVGDILTLPMLPKNVRSLSDDDAARKLLTQTESTPVMVEGYFAMTKMAGKEGVNCGLADRLDLRMELRNDRVDDPSSSRQLHMVAEGTPWFQEAREGWTVANLGTYSSYTKGFKDQDYRGPPTKIRVYGFLFFDEAHAYDGSVGKIRATPWEIHPVVRIEVYDNNQWKEVK